MAPPTHCKCCSANNSSLAIWPNASDAISGNDPEQTLHCTGQRLVRLGKNWDGDYPHVLVVVPCARSEWRRFCPDSSFCSTVPTAVHESGPLLTSRRSAETALVECRPADSGFVSVDKMLGNQVLGGSSIAQATRPALQLGRVSTNRVIPHVKQTSRCRAAAQISKQHFGKASYPSSGSKAAHGPTRAPRRKVASHATNNVHAASSSTAPGAKSSLTPVLMAVAVASLGALLFGLHVAIVNGLQDAVSAELGFSGNTGLRGAVSLCAFARFTPVSALVAFCIHCHLTLQMVSMVLAGATIGSTSGSGLADGLGRRKSFLLSTIPLILGSVLCATAGSANALLAGRFLCGMGIGLTSAVTPVYISEVSILQLTDKELQSCHQSFLCCC